MKTTSNGNIFHVTGPLGRHPPVTSGFPSQRPVTWSFHISFDLRLSKRLNKPSHKREGHCRLEKSWWRHQIKTFSALLAICAGYLPVTGEFPAQRPVMRSFDVFFDRRLNKRLSKQWWGWWFETPSYPLWRHGSVYKSYYIYYDKNWKWINLSAKDKKQLRW